MWWAARIPSTIGFIAAAENSTWIPLRWPPRWGASHYRTFARGPVNCIVVDEPPAPDLVATYAADGIAVTTLKDAGVALPQGCKWPGVETGGNSGTDAGPTGVPWVNANGYLVQLARSLNPGKPVWLDYGTDTLKTTDMDRLAICDAAAYGGCWVMRPETEDWAALTKTSDFFLRHRAWHQYRPIANLAVVADFGGPNRAVAVETLNLLARRLVPYVINPSDLSGFASVLRLDQRSPGDDPFQIAADAHRQMGRRHDLVRLWNDGSMNVNYTASPDGREHLVQLINYAATPSSDQITLGLARAYKSAVLTTLDDPPKPLAIHSVRAGIELQLPPFPVYAAISLRP